MADAGTIQRLLLHACCGPCAMWPLAQLREDGVDVTLLYANPNIHPEVEWERRLESLETAADHYACPLIVDGRPVTAPWRTRADAGVERCRFCYETRLTRLAEIAEERGFDAVSSTLLVSPYQHRELILDVAETITRGTGIRFIPYDWRPGFRRGQNMARELGLYRQKYCGCIVSLDDSRFRDRIERDHDRLAMEHCLNLCAGDLVFAAFAEE
jgi:predicted adenine nucleotide alpha hydrolase (AANH) superfamily ATPase